MRITGGKARGIPLKAPKGDTTRPATDRIREAVFSSLGPTVENCHIADLFAGTGSYGLEAVSRGAATATFYEINRSALNCLRQNILKVSRSCEINTATIKIITHDVFSPHANNPAFDLIFIDPPYGIIESKLNSIFQDIVELIATENARVILELPGNLSPELENWHLKRRIGKIGKDKPSIAIFERRKTTPLQDQSH